MRPLSKTMNAKCCIAWIAGGKTMLLVMNFLLILKVSIGDNTRYMDAYMTSSTTGGSVKINCKHWNCNHNFSRNVNGFQELSFEDGITLMVLYENTAEVLLQKTFPTWMQFTHPNDMLWWLGRLRPGRLVIMVVQRAGILGLENYKHVLAKLGSVLINKISFDALWIWIWISGGQTIMESYSPIMRSPYNQNVMSHTILQFFSEIKSWPSKLSDYESICNKGVSLGNLCHSNNTFKKQIGRISLPFTYKHIDVRQISKYNVLDNISIIICAGSRIQYLAATLEALFKNPDVRKEKILVAVGTSYTTGKPSSSIIKLLDILMLDYQILSPLKQNKTNYDNNHHNFQFYRSAWMLALTTFPQSNYFAFIDEDILVTTDWLYLLTYAAPILEKDSTLWCITPSGYVHGGPSNLLLRGLRQPGWGYLVRAKDVEKAIRIWPTEVTTSSMYDVWMYEKVGGKRECVFPAKSRMVHFGVGINTVPEIQHFYSIKAILHDGSLVEFTPLNHLIDDQYDKRLISSLSNAAPLLKDPCKHDFLSPPKNYDNYDYIFYFFYDDTLDGMRIWALLGECLEVWPYSFQYFHKGVQRVPLSWGGSLWLVGCPHSSFSYLRPKNVSLWFPRNEAYFDQQREFTEHLHLFNTPNYNSFNNSIIDLFGVS